MSPSILDQKGVRYNNSMLNMYSSLTNSVRSLVLLWSAILASCYSVVRNGRSQILSQFFQQHLVDTVLLHLYIQNIELVSPSSEVCVGLEWFYTTLNVKFRYLFQTLVTGKLVLLYSPLSSSQECESSGVLHLEHYFCCCTCFWATQIVISSEAISEHLISKNISEGACPPSLA